MGGPSFELPNYGFCLVGLSPLPLMSRHGLGPQQLLAMSGCGERLGRVCSLGTEQRTDLRLERLNVAVGLR